MKLALLMVGATLLVPAPLPAQNAPAIVAARAAGQVGERYDGYLGYVAAPRPGLRTQVDSVNIRRRALYTGLAAKRGASPQEVAITAGCELLATVGAGEAYMLADNIWRRRTAGQAVPVPTYCRP